MKLPNNGFKFNCGFDICTFPIQYCDTDDKRCGYCSPDICNSGNIPEQCLTECNGLSSSVTVGPSIDSMDTGQYSAGVYVIAILALLLVVILYVEKIWKYYKGCNKTTPKCGINYEPVPENQPDQVAVVLDREDTEEKIQEQPSAPPKSSDNTESYRDGTIVANPEDRNEFNSHNFGDHNILPANMEESPDVPFQSNQMNGPVSHPINEKKCEKVDHNILHENFKTGIQDTTTHTIVGSANATSCGNSLGFNIKTPDLTTVKEQTSRVC